MTFQSLKTLNPEGKTVLLRLDLNVPVKNGKVSDSTRIRAATETVQYLAQNKAKTLIMAHFGRPKGERKPEFSFTFIPPTLEDIWGMPVKFCSEAVGEKAKDFVESLQPGEIGLLENMRFYAEEKNDPEFSKQLASLGDIYVNDAFSNSHRAHSSMHGITEFLPSYPGFAMEKELKALESTLKNPQKPVCAIVAGSKISTKLDLLENLVEKMDYLILGGAMPNTFFFARGLSVGNSLHEPDMAETAKKIMEKAEEEGCKLILPKDQKVVREFKEGAPYEIVAPGTLESNQEGLDIGPETIENIQNILKECKTVLWNGPVGVFEMKPFHEGTNEIAKTVAALTKEGKITSVAGGGDTVSALEKADVVKDLSFVSTAGGAFLEYLEGKTLPAVAALQNHKLAA